MTIAEATKHKFSNKSSKHRCVASYFCPFNRCMHNPGFLRNWKSFDLLGSSLDFMAGGKSELEFSAT